MHAWGLNDWQAMAQYAQHHNVHNHMRMECPMPLLRKHHNVHNHMPMECPMLILRKHLALYLVCSLLQRLLPLVLAFLAINRQGVPYYFPILVLKVLFELLLIPTRVRFLVSLHLVTCKLP